MNHLCDNHWFKSQPYPTIKSSSSAHAITAKIHLVFLFHKSQPTTTTLYSFAFGFSCFSMASATILRWILPVAVFGMLSVKNI